MNNVSYRVLKSNIIKACRQTKEKSIEFVVDYKKLKDLVEDINLVPMFVGLESKRLDPELVPYLSEYFDKSHMTWLSDSKFCTVITFIDAQSIDEKAQELLDSLHVTHVDDPENDNVANYAALISNYPCYFATIVSYKNNSPTYSDKPSYEIACRANKVTIRKSDYQYNSKDF